jgi:hypothetical protein
VVGKFIPQIFLKSRSFFGKTTQLPPWFEILNWRGVDWLDRTSAVITGKWGPQIETQALDWDVTQVQKLSSHFSIGTSKLKPQRSWETMAIPFFAFECSFVFWWCICWWREERMRVQKDLYFALFVFVKRACVSKCTRLLSVIYVKYLCGKQKLVLECACVCVCVCVCGGKSFEYVWRKRRRENREREKDLKWFELWCQLYMWKTCVCILCVGKRKCKHGARGVGGQQGRNCCHIWNVECVHDAWLFQHQKIC